MALHADISAYSPAQTRKAAALDERARIDALDPRAS